LKFEIPEKKTFLDSHTIQVRWGDMDALGHINNAMYFRYMESARVAYLSKIGILLGHDNQSFVLANTMCNFILPISYPANLTIETYVSKLGNSSVDFIHKFINNDKKDEITAIGLATAVWVNLIKNKAIALPKQIKDKLNRVT
tara:strand:+ start:95 stop:523 length:429 start_codon:yes stop_codon:yes gene_type:complete